MKYVAMVKQKSMKISNNQISKWSKNDRQYNGQKKKDKQRSTKPKIEQHEPHGCIIRRRVFSCQTQSDLLKFNTKQLKPTVISANYLFVLLLKISQGNINLYYGLYKNVVFSLGAR